MSYREVWQAKKMQYQNMVDVNTNTPVDDYNFWKNILNEKNDNRESIPNYVYESYAIAEMAVQDYLLEMNIGC